MYSCQPPVGVVDFTASATDPDEGDEVTYSWDFDGDGTPDSSQQNPSHTYTQPGGYAAKLTVSDGEATASRTIPIQVLVADDPQARFRVLVFSKTAGFRHTSIDEGHAAVEQLGAEHDFQVDHTEDAPAFRPAVLSHYDTVVFLSTTGDVLNAAQQTAFEEYIRGGGGYAGIHSASDTEYDWSWYGKLVGAYFRNHPANQTATVHVEDDAHPSTAGLPDSYERFDEWYNFKSPDFETVGGGDYSPRENVHVLVNVDEATYDESDGNATDDDHPVTWCRRYDGGRSWYTAMGHTEASFTEANFLAQVLGGLETTAGVAESRACGVFGDPPTVRPTADPGSGEAPVRVRFTAEGTDPDGPSGHLTYAWDFGDGATSDSQNVFHTYTEPGTYTARVRVTDVDGQTGTGVVRVTVPESVNEAPTVVAKATPSSGTAPLRVRLEATGTDPDGPSGQLAYRWDFGDGATSESQNVFHRYTEPGTYTAKVTVTDEGRATGSAEVTITVGAAGGG